jgi:Zn-finger nucleic acid-binding protein
MSVYRQPTRTGCPRCGIELEQYPDRDKWRCTQCNGILLGLAELEHELATLVTLGQRIDHPNTDPLICPRCGGDMMRATIGDIDVDRCPEDGAVWFDRGELGQIRAKAPRRPIATPRNKPR